MIVFDTETTGLIKNGNVPLDQQPEIIEFCGVRLHDETLEQIGDTVVFTCKPRILPLPEIITKITGLTTEDVSDKLPWVRHVGKVEDLFIGETMCVAHNCDYDIGMMTLEQRRLDRLTKFPWPTKHVCTVDATRHIKGHRLKLGELYEYLFERPMGVAHRAEVDVQNLVEVTRELRKRALI